MARVEVLGGLCGASVNYGGVRGSAAGALQGVEAAGYLSGLSVPATRLAMAKYMGDDVSLVWLKRYVRTWVIDLAVTDRWFDDPTALPNQVFYELPVSEVVSPGCCKRCNGVGFVSSRVCVKCNGSGHVLMSDRSIARELCMHPEAFRRSWRDRYVRVLAMVQSLDAEVCRSVSRQVCNDAGLGF